MKYSKPLHILERRLLRALQQVGEASLEDVIEKSDMKPDQARRALEWLKAKEMVESLSASRTRLSLGPEGSKAASLGLPERRFINIIKEKGGSAALDSVKALFAESPEEYSVALGQCRRRGWIKISQEGGKQIVGCVLHQHRLPEEDLLQRLSREDVFEDPLSEAEREAAQSLSQRPRYIVRRKVKTVVVKIAELGRSTIQSLSDREELGSLTPELIASGGWRGQVLRGIDVESPSPRLYPGRRHPVQMFIDEVREVFVSMGFEEVEGPLVQPCFWNFDALFTPQDHPARDMQDTFYVEGLEAKEVATGDVIERVAAVHENGGDTGSRGWGYRWRRDLARRLVLRTHTTCVTVKYLADHRPDEARVFSVGRVFRNEKVTFKNLVEFHQIEGIVVGERVTLRDLMGLLTSFYDRLGLKKVKFWPSYFPYTEPSMQTVVYSEKAGKWMELCGMGIFRPEVTLPLGVKKPVLAWGGGLERLVMLRYGVDDVRELYGNDIGWIRRTPLCL